MPKNKKLKLLIIEVRFYDLADALPDGAGWLRPTRPALNTMSSPCLVRWKFSVGSLSRSTRLKARR
jgi:hypothetical protein